MSRKAAWPPPIITRRGKSYLVLRAAGQVHEFCLGVEGSEEARCEFRRVVAELEANGRTPLPRSVDAPRVAEVVAAFLTWKQPLHAASHFHRLATALGILSQLYGHLPAAELTPARLDVVRSSYVEAGYCRSLCNQMTNVVRQCWRWAVVRGLVSVEVPTALAMLPALRKRQTTAPDHPKVPPVARSVVEATLPHLPPILADLVRVQLLAGMRPAEACALRPVDLDRAPAALPALGVWLYRLGDHKTDWKGGERVIPLGPRVQAILTPYLDRDPTAYCFSPLEVRQAFARSRGRSPRFGRSRTPGARYPTSSYGHAILRACRRAGVPDWSPNQLRHTAGTTVETEFGREDARVFLGHSTPSTTAIYAEGTERAARIAARIG